ncbi:MAG TPA: hypothetical protein PLJ47_12065 [Candidatus Hydrogenedentes bacterium]|nr:hypothetical protein [Candidatus Hydrogenedentota bacterium]HRK35321.1 hypothetical protein [Candidatus Hydrogenedentota bacterium]
MTKFKRMGAIAIVMGVVILVVGGARLRAASNLVDGASEHLRRQHEVHAAFQTEAQEVTKRYHAGELDEAGWHSETESVMTQFKRNSESAGNSWLAQLSLANKTQMQGFGLLLAGIICVATGVIVATKRSGTFRSAK